MIKRNIDDKEKLIHILDKIDRNQVLDNNDSEYIQHCLKLLRKENIKILKKVYNEVLLREPDKDGLEFWLAKMENESLGPAEIEQIFLSSEEHIKRKSVKEYYEKIQSRIEEKTKNVKDISIEELNQICNTSGYSVSRGLTIKYFHKVSIYLTKILLMKKVSADAVTISAASIAILGSYFLSTANFFLMIVGIILVEFHFFLDIVDGEIARYNKTSSPSGAYLDLITHFISSPLIWIGFSIGFFMLVQETLILIIGLLLAIAAVMSLADYALFYAVVPYTIFTKGKNAKYIPDNSPKDLLSERVLKFINKYLVLQQPGTFHVVTICSAGLVLGTVIKEIYSVILVFIGIYSILLNLSWILIVYSNVKNKTIERRFWYRE